MTMRVGIYCRVSTKKQSCDPQLQACRSFAAARGWSIAGEYVENAVSGATSRRPQLDRLLADARARRIDVVAVVKLDRLGRSLAHLIGLLNEFRELGVDFVAISQSLDTSTSSGKLLMNLLAAIAEFERELIRDRVLAGLELAKLRGVRLGRPRREVDEKEILRVYARTGSIRETAKAVGGISRSLVFRIIRRHKQVSAVVSAAGVIPGGGVMPCPAPIPNGIPDTEVR